MMVKIRATKSMYKSVSFDNCNDENIKKNHSGSLSKFIYKTNY